MNIIFGHRISEENFWRNYFYRVSLICQASELNLMAQEGNNLESRTNIDATGEWLLEKTNHLSQL